MFSKLKKETRTLDFMNRKEVSATLGSSIEFC